MEKKVEQPSIGYSYLILALISAFMCFGMIVFKGKLQAMMFLSWLIVVPMTMKLGYSFESLETFAYDMVRKVMQPSLILLAIGGMIGSWILAGTVPTLIYGGLKIISPRFFLLTTLLFCSIVSLATGTSWGTIGTAGLAMIGIGPSLGIPPGITAGAIISGAFFGDKMSPLSDSTNLAPAVSGGQLIPHIKHMVWTTGPAYLITAALFTFIGFRYSGEVVDYQNIDTICTQLSDIFKIGLIPLIPALVVFYLLLTKKPPVLAIMIGSVVAAVVSIAYQGNTIASVLSVFYKGYQSDTGMVFLDKLLNRGGVASMYSLVGLFIFALGLGGMLQGTGVLNSILESFSKKIQSTRGVIVATIIVSYLSNMIGATISFASVMTGTLMAPVYKKWNLKPENLSRVIEDCGTLGGPIIPWNTGAVYAAGTLGVSSLAFIPFCFLCWITPIVSLIYGLTGFTITQYSEEELKALNEGVDE